MVFRVPYLKVSKIKKLGISNAFCFLFEAEPGFQMLILISELKSISCLVKMHNPSNWTKNYRIIEENVGGVVDRNFVVERL